MNAAPVPARIRQVLDAPPGCRFSRPGATTPPTPGQSALTREQHLLTQGQLPPWKHLQAQRLATQPEPARPDRPDTAPVPRPRSAPDDGPPPARTPKRPVRPRPPLPRRHPDRPRSHRKPAPRPGLVLMVAAHILALGVGVLAAHLLFFL
ncbi:hypothetical protein [Nocardiopsis algeriensis]|uniref:Uncharacterized protein n=1 Tax=Nocardiopsis algeriensis TaxID=1478215 RepID=A0A841J1M9_9ACTN|nr:hypothetical protein [Nocardiopsis algeriensis]MBB6122231.1 hypothetical protein [Nocardiopsis algeriensis]